MWIRPGYDTIRSLMLVGQFSPLAPAAVLLLGAFLLSVVFPVLPVRWQSERMGQLLAAPALAGLALLTVVGTRLSLNSSPAGMDSRLLSAWNFSAEDSIATLSVQVDGVSLAFLILICLLLLAVTLAYPLSPPSEQKQKAIVAPLTKRWTRMAGWLTMGAAASLALVSISFPTIAYAILIFDFTLAVFWLRRGQASLSIARLFLGLFTAAGLALLAVDAAAGVWWLGLALWLRLGLYLFMEITRLTGWSDDSNLVYVVVSLGIGLYLVVRSGMEGLPLPILWLAVVLMLLNGAITWLAEEREELLLRLTATAALLILLHTPISPSLATAFTVGLLLSLAALWLTPRLGRPHLSERAWSWPYLPAAGATLTLIGLPWSLGWPARTAVYGALYLSENLGLIVLAVLAEALALSGLGRYWRLVGQGVRENGQQAVASVIIMVPFLIPGLAPLILTTITRMDMDAALFELPGDVLLTMAVVIAGAAGLAYYRSQILELLNLSPVLLMDRLKLTWLQTSWETTWQAISKFALRVEVFLEGQHYMGWALLTALVGVLIIFLGR